MNKNSLISAYLEHFAACLAWLRPIITTPISWAECGALLKKLKFNSKVLIDLATCPANVKLWITIFHNFKYFPAIQCVHRHTLQHQQHQQHQQRLLRLQITPHRHGPQPPAYRKKQKAADTVNGLHSRHRAGSSACENAPSAIYAPLRHSRREETPHE